MKFHAQRFPHWLAAILLSILFSAWLHGCACADWIVQYEIRGRLLDTTGQGLVRELVEVTLFQGADVVGYGSDVTTTDSDGNFVLPIAFIDGVCAPAGIIRYLPREDPSPDAASIRVRYNDCTHEMTVTLTEDRISGEFPFFLIELGTREVPACE